MFKTPRTKKGFTLIEAIVVIAILAIIVGIAAPSAKRIIDDGRAVARSNTARSIFVAAQNALSELQADGELREFSEGFYNADGSYNSVNRVYAELGSAPAGEDIDLVRYISKSSGAASPASNKVMELLADTYGDAETLNNNAIVIEYNIETGVVLSVFISDKDTGSNTPRTLLYGGGDSYSDISGARPYTLADERDQGYCGVAVTGTPDERVYPMSAAIYDGASKPLDGERDVLYAAFDLHSSYFNGSGKTVTVMLLNESGELDVPLAEKEVTIVHSMPNSLPAALARQSEMNGQTMWYEQSGDELAANYYRVYWLLDRVDDNMTQLARLRDSFGVKYHTISTGTVIRSAVKPAYGSAVVSDSSACAGYAQKNGLSYTVKTARHLFNVRYLSGGSFIQLEDISLDGIIMSPLDTDYNSLGGSAAGEFAGSYQASENCVISNFEIDLGNALPASLFGNSTGRLYGINLTNSSISGGSGTGGIVSQNNSGGLVSGVSLANCVVSSAGSCGGVAGSNFGHMTECGVDDQTRITSSSSGAGGVVGINAGAVTTCASNGKVSGYSEAGGIAGQNLAGGSITNCTTDAGATVHATNITVGGIAGSSGGAVTDCVNRGAVTLTYDEYHINAGGIVGYNLASGTITNCINEHSIKAHTNAGGIVGANYGSVLSCENKAPLVEGVNQTGGIAGTSYLNSSISNSVNRAAVTASGGDGKVGGVAGENVGTIVFSSNHGNVSGDYRVGGLVGLNNAGASISGNSATEFCWNDGNVGGGGTAVGGIVGENLGDVNYTECRVKLTLFTVTGSSFVGGIAGINGGNITNSVSGIAAEASHTAGGIAGENTGTIRTCYSVGEVKAADASQTTAVGFGGIAGINGGVVDICLSSSAVSGYSDVGGIVGQNEAAGAVTDVEYSSIDYTLNAAGTAVEKGAITGTLQTGGIAGNNLGSVERAVFAAAAPLNAGLTDMYPITGADTGTVGDAHYLSGTDFKKNTDPALLGASLNRASTVGSGTAESSAALAALTFSGSTVWELKSPYPYPLPSTGYTPTSWLETN